MKIVSKQLLSGIFLTTVILSSLWYYLPILFPEICRRYSPFVELLIRSDCKRNEFGIPPVLEMQDRFPAGHFAAIRIAHSSWYSVDTRKVAANVIAWYWYLDIDHDKCRNEIYIIRNIPELKSHCDFILSIPYYAAETP